MKCSKNHLYTPLYLKLNPSTDWPRDEKVFYLLSSNGLFLCRNHPFFRSCVPARSWPAELGAQPPFLNINYPKIPTCLIEQIVGFFHRIGKLHSSEAAALLVWNRQSNQVEALVPDQTATVGHAWWGKKYPIDIHYEIPPLPRHLMMIGDIHSHVDYPAFASATDKADEQHRPGLHIVVGRLWDEPPEFHCEVIADGMRFPVRDLKFVLEGYRRRKTKKVPTEWIDRVKVKRWTCAKPDPNGQLKPGAAGDFHTLALPSDSTSLPNNQEPTSPIHDQSQFNAKQDTAAKDS